MHVKYVSMNNIYTMIQICLGKDEGKKREKSLRTLIKWEINYQICHERISHMILTEGDTEALWYMIEPISINKSIYVHEFP